MKKKGGRTAGTPNKITATIREKLELILNQCFEDLNIHELSKREKIELIGKILPFLVPKLNTITVDENTKENQFTRMKIDNIETLLKFLRENWNNISDKNYNEILLKTLNVYEGGKRETYEETEQLILKYIEFIDSSPTNWEKPIFLELEL